MFRPTHITMEDDLRRCEASLQEFCSRVKRLTMGQTSCSVTEALTTKILKLCVCYTAICIQPVIITFRCLKIPMNFKIWILKNYSSVQYNSRVKVQERSLLQR